MQPCESRGYLVDNGIVIGVGTHKVDVFKAATAAQVDAVKKVQAEANKSARNNTETCQRGCKRRYRVEVMLTPAAGPGEYGKGWVLQMALHWALYMDCVKKAPPPKPAPPPKKPGKIYVGPVDSLRPPEAPSTGKLHVHVVGEE